MGTPPLRLVRSTVFAAVCVTLTSAAHATAAGAAMAPWTLAAGFLGVFAFAWLLAGHERSLPTILGGLAGGQFMLHSLFAEGGHLHHGGDELLAAQGNGTGMTLAHLAAAAVSAWWLRRGERGVWRLARQIVRSVLRPAVLPGLPARAAVPRPVELPVVAPATAFLRHVLVLRGPPVASPTR